MFITAAAAAAAQASKMEILARFANADEIIPGLYLGSFSRRMRSSSHKERERERERENPPHLADVVLRSLSYRIDVSVSFVGVSAKHESEAYTHRVQGCSS